MPNPIVTHLLNDAGERLCCAQDGPATPLTSLLEDTCAEGATFSPDCALTVLAPIVELDAYFEQIGGRHD